jgi:hypothetical protein
MEGVAIQLVTHLLLCVYLSIYPAVQPARTHEIKGLTYNNILFEKLFLPFFCILILSEDRLMLWY